MLEDDHTEKARIKEASNVFNYFFRFFLEKLMK